ncbi:hypothetical protein Nepgr_026949 [Nepenthes gracilis]|uniref:Polygalacturonase n=1 Tax=Nepenthes gracilis TaxID=150966 RepID=A0AAD3T9J7_NEPGR|nr:hypothetical protein Nepgr_026949 [Nepenthes gracilis]
MDEEKPFFAAVISGGTIRHSWVFLLLMFTVTAVFTLQAATKTFSSVWPLLGQSDAGDHAGHPTCSGFFRPVPPRKFVVSVTEFGAVGDGRTLNTEAFRKAVQYLKSFENRGGSQLNVPNGTWITGSFNLSSNFTLFLDEGAIILASQDPKDWPIIEPLPSYGRGRERLGGRHMSLIHGNGLTNVVITGNNGTVDGQGKIWWDQWWNRTLEHTRGHLVELMNSNNIMISNLTFRNSPFWTIHPVYCSNVLIKNMTILAPLNAPNTDGIDPDSSVCICIEDCYIESGDDLVAVKSGWDQYGIRTARPSSNIIVRRVSGTTPTCSGVSIGSEMSGGISNITLEDIHVRDSASGVRIKTEVGRGGYIVNISVVNIALKRVKTPVKFSRGANDHPDGGWDPNAIPRVVGIFIADMVSVNSTKAPELLGMKDAPYEGICMKNISILGLPSSATWHCEYVSGFTSRVYPSACPQLMSNISSPSWCSVA